MYYDKDWKPHETHDMSEWDNTIVTLVETPRFGRIRHCLNCGAEQAETAAGRSAHKELANSCTCIG